MNHARGGLRTCLHRGIWEYVGQLLEDSGIKRNCGKWASTAGHYFAALVKIEAYPLEKHFPKNSVNKLLERLEMFHMGPIGTCFKCCIDWNSKVKEARKSTRRYFDGLCIDCMDRSRPKRDNTDLDYWKQAESINGRWDHNCRILHGEPSWYVSWCGRDEHRQKLLAIHRGKNLRNLLRG